MAGNLAGTVYGKLGGNLNAQATGGIIYPAGGASAPTVPVWQPALGTYVQNTLAPTADTPAIGVNTTTKFNPPTSLVMEVPDSLVAVNDNATRGGEAQFVRAAGVISPLTNGGRCNIAAGVATANASGTNVCYVIGGVALNDYFFAPVFA
jgi:hypothetical protein